MLKRARLSLVASAVMAAVVMPLAGAGEVAAAPAKARACTERLEGVFCGYYSGTAYSDRGDAGSKVKEIQALLIYHGFAVKVDGYFGAGTESAVKKFQKRMQLKADGIVGPTTWGWLRAERLVS